MPAWIAGIQVRRMHPEDIHVSLHPNAPCWNEDARCAFKRPSPSIGLFSKQHTKAIKSSGNCTL